MGVRHPHLLRVVACLGLLALAPPAAGAADRPLPKGKALTALVRAYLDADLAERARMRARWDAELAPLEPKALPKLRAELLKIAGKHGPKLAKAGTHYLLDEEQKRGKYIASGKPGRTLFVALHGGGAGSGTAAAFMGGGGWWWIYPEVLEKTEHGWTDAGTEQFVMALIEAAKRTGRVDPDRIYITGHSMGGFGAWTLGAHHADVFAGIAPYAGAPTCVRDQRDPEGPYVAVQPGILPNLYAVALHVYQSGDDRNVPPESNDFALQELVKLKARWPGGFEFRYDRVEGRGHAAPEQGYLPSQKWLAGHVRNPRPRAFLWQPVLPWKKHFYWVYWDRADLEAILEVRARDGNVAEITTQAGTGDVSGLSVLLGPPLFDLAHDVTIRVNGERVFRGPVRHTFSTLMLTLVRNDEGLLFDARVDL